MLMIPPLQGLKHLFSMSKNVLYLQNAFGSTWRDLIE